MKEVIKEKNEIKTKLEILKEEFTVKIKFRFLNYIFYS